MLHNTYINAAFILLFNFKIKLFCKLSIKLCNYCWIFVRRIQISNQVLSKTFLIFILNTNQPFPLIVKFFRQLKYECPLKGAISEITSWYCNIESTTPTIKRSMALV